MTTAAITWNDWSPGIFERATAEGRLVFLDITAKWCHWCHVLDGTSLSDPRVAAALGKDYIAVRVDTDRRPDINDRYNQGGWPSVAVLLPDGRTLTGATYLPPDALLALIEKCAAFYRNDRDRIDAWIAETSSRAKSTGAATGAAEAGEGPGEDQLPLVRQAVLGQIDPVDPGFFGEPKFLMVESLAFLRDGWLFEPGVETGEAFLAILRRMVRSDVFDAVEGGFFRYATRRDWTVPHYEKLLADNAGMLSLCASAYELSGEPVFAEAARGTLRFLLMSLFDRESGAFFASQDADEAYYSLSAEERALRNPPPVDRTLISEYNAAAVTALIAAARAFPDDRDVAPDDGLLKRAIGLGEFLWGMSGPDDEGQDRYRDEAGGHAGQLADNVAVAACFLDLWEATRSEVWLERASVRLDWMLRRLFDESKSRFADRIGTAGDAGLLAVPRHPFQLNAAAASALIRCGREAMRADLFAAGKSLLGRLAEDFGEGLGPFAAPYGSALLRYWHGRAGKGCLPGDPACEG
jgi:uncharacterized protein YyaL (SSP411 family)